MRNTHVVCGRVTYVVVRRRNGKAIKAKINTRDLRKIKAISGTWCAMQHRYTTYIYAKDYSGQGRGVQGGGRTIYMHREVLGLSDDDPRVVNHLDWDGTNNTRENLEVTSDAENNQYRRVIHTPTRRSRTGVRNVSRKGSRFQVIVRHKYLGVFRSTKQADRIARAERLRLHAEMKKNDLFPSFCSIGFWSEVPVH